MLVFAATHSKLKVMEIKKGYCSCFHYQDGKYQPLLRVLCDSFLVSSVRTMKGEVGAVGFYITVFRSTRQFSVSSVRTMPAHVGAKGEVNVLCKEMVFEADCVGIDVLCRWNQSSSR